MHIKKQTDQAIRILVHLSNSGRTMVGKELAGLVGASDKYMPFIMRQLRRAGLVSSTSGISGGYVLAKDAKEITLLDIMTATADEPQISCYGENEKESARFGASDVLLKNYDFVQGMVMRYFDSLTVWDLSKPERLNAFYARMGRINDVFAANSPDSCGDGVCLGGTANQPDKDAACLTQD